MNKIFTSILALACLGVADASAVTLTCDGQQVKDGDEITIGYTAVGPLAQWEPNFTATGTPGSNLVVSVSATPADLQKFFQDCSFGVCKEAPRTTVYHWGTEEEMLQGGNVDFTSYPVHLEIHRQTDLLDKVKNQGDLQGVLTVYEENNPDDKVTVTINFLVKPAEEVGALDNVAANGEYVRLESGNTLSYNLNGNTHIEVYSILGTRMIDRHVSGHGSLSLSGLGRGVYIYRAGKLSGKVVVK